MKVTFRIRRQVYADSKRNSYSVTVPSDIAERLLAAGVFGLELAVTDEGLLYRIPAAVEEPSEPTWLRELTQ